MKRERLFLALIITASIVFLIDLAFVIFFVCQIALNISGRLLIFSGFWWIALSVIIINAIELIFCITYIFIRKE